MCPKRGDMFSIIKKFGGYFLSFGITYIVFNTYVIVGPIFLIKIETIL